MVQRPHLVTLMRLAVLTIVVISAVVSFMLSEAQAQISSVVAGDAVQPQSGVLDDPSLEPFMDGLIRAQMDANRIPGLSISITEGDRIVFLKGYGFADVEKQIPVDPETHLFRVASVSKPFAWMSLLQLADAGKVDLDQDVNAYLDFVIPDTFPGHPIRIRNLATHTTGFEAVNISTSARTPAEQDSLGDALKRLEPRRVRMPGVLTNYSNYGAAIGGYIVERVSGEDYPDYLENHIFTPLGMKHSTMRQPPEGVLADRLVTGYTTSGGEVVPGEYSYLEIYPDGALQTTAGDMARFALAHMNPQEYGSVLSPAGFEAMRQPQFSNIPQVSAMTFGFEQKIWNGRVAYGHGGDTECFTARFLIFPEESVSIFIALNTDSGGEARDNIVQAFMDRYFAPEKDTMVFSDQPVLDASDDVADNYISTRRNFSTIEKLFWPLSTGISIERLSDDMLQVAVLGETYPYRRESVGVYLPDITALNGANGIGALISTKDPGSGKRMVYFAQNGSFAFEEAPFIERMSLQLLWLLLAFMLVLAGSGVSLSAGLSKQVNMTALTWGGVLLGLTGAVCAFIFIPLAAARFTNELIFGVPDSFYVIFALPLVGVVLASAGCGLVWRSFLQRRTVSRRLVCGMSMIVVALLLYSVQLSVWNMFGFSGLPA